MQINSLRPSIFETSYRLFERDLHPELFEPAVVGHIKTSLYSMDFGICDGGHFLRFSSEGETMLEVTGPVGQELSMHGLQQREVFGGSEEISVESSEPFIYHFAGQVDTVDPAVFTRVEMELQIEAKRAFLSHQFQSSNRLFAGPLSLAKVEGTERSLTLHVFHTFPQDLAVLRTQTLFELPEWNS